MSGPTKWQALKFDLIHCSTGQTPDVGQHWSNSNTLNVAKAGSRGSTSAAAPTPRIALGVDARASLQPRRVVASHLVPLPFRHSLPAMWASTSQLSLLTLAALALLPTTTAFSLLPSCPLSSKSLLRRCGSSPSRMPPLHLLPSYRRPRMHGSGFQGARAARAAAEAGHTP